MGCGGFFFIFLLLLLIKNISIKNSPLLPPGKLEEKKSSLKEKFYKGLLCTLKSFIKYLIIRTDSSLFALLFFWETCHSMINESQDIVIYTQKIHYTVVG